MKESVKCGLGISGIFAAGAAAGIGIKAGVQKLLQARKDKKAKEAEAKVSEK